MNIYVLAILALMLLPPLAHLSARRVPRPLWPGSSVARLLWHRVRNARDHFRLEGLVWGLRRWGSSRIRCAMCGSRHATFTSRNFCNYCRGAYPDAHQNERYGHPTRLSLYRGARRGCIECGHPTGHYRGCVD